MTGERTEGAPAADAIRRMVTDLVQMDPDQMSAGEYLYAAERLSTRSPCNLLVFGTGNDSPLWLSANAGGRTAFLEDSASWIRVVRWRLPEIEVFQVRYGTRRGQWQELLQQDLTSLALRLPSSLSEEPWDFILVDGPAGHGDDCPGRMRSIATAAALARKGPKAVDLIVHDCDRPVEQAFCDAFFAPQELVREFDRTRHYHILPAQ